MPKKEMPAGALLLMILLVLQAGPRRGYAIAQRIHVLSAEVLHLEKGALRKILVDGWAMSAWGVSETSRKHRETELAGHRLVNDAIQAVFESA